MRLHSFDRSTHIITAAPEFFAVVDLGPDVEVIIGAKVFAGDLSAGGLLDWHAALNGYRADAVSPLADKHSGYANVPCKVIRGFVRKVLIEVHNMKLAWS